MLIAAVEIKSGYRKQGVSKRPKSVSTLEKKSIWFKMRFEIKDGLLFNCFNFAKLFCSIGTTSYSLY